jgi:hypothetical protein
MTEKKRRCPYLPDGYQKTIFDIDYEGLAASGIQTILFDLDNTVLPYDEWDPSPRIISLFRRIKSRGFTIVVISNNHRPRVKRFAEAVDCPYVCDAKKPFSWGFRKAARLGPTSDPARILVIGDQFVTDVWGGKRLGYRVIVVDALKRGTEKWYTRMNRKWEELMLKKIQRNFPDLYVSLHLAEKR